MELYDETTDVRDKGTLAKLDNYLSSQTQILELSNDSFCFSNSLFLYCSITQKVSLTYFHISSLQSSVTLKVI